ncbi:MAG TPA: hypothetical protein VJ732_00015, partial [Bryobacteraceae bacterium]|nr:hypothetical protein [Bryobacteraceae bacterium]
IADSDFWWHLKTGQFIWQTHKLPVPDPFAYTTAVFHPAYAGEDLTRHFNLTHEWLSQSLFYLGYRVAGFPGVVLLRAVVLALFCGLVALIVYRRTKGFYRSLAASFVTAAFAAGFALDRPYIFTFLLLAATVAILEFRRPLWLLPVVMLVWANCHGGFFLGWIVLGAYCLAEHRNWRLLAWSAAAILISGVNPNGFRVLQILTYYRRSFLTSTLLEWARPALWPPGIFTLLLAGAPAALLWARRKGRISDWLLYAAFAAAAITAQRNIVLVGFVAPIIIASYLPWRPRVPVWANYGVAVLVLAGLGTGVARASFFQLRAAEWKFPKGAADFLAAHHVTGPMFNSYEYGGYLIWRLWPQERVFIDGRALSESLFLDYTRILYNHDESGGKSAQELLDQYGVDVIVSNAFEYASGTLYLLVPSLADPQQTKWKLVYSGPEAAVFMRHPPAGVEPIDSMKVFDHLEEECETHIEHEPDFPRCARSLGQVFYRGGDFARARRWIGVYLSHPHEPDPEAERTFQQLMNNGR